MVSKELGFRPLEDSDAPDRLREIVAAWRHMAKEMSYGGPIIWLVPGGFSFFNSEDRVLFPDKLKERAELAAEWVYLDPKSEVTSRCLAFWLPFPLDGTEGKNAEQQRAILSGLRQHFGLPKNHLSSFGKASTLIGLILANLRIGDQADQWDGAPMIRSSSLLRSVFDEAGVSAGISGKNWALSLNQQYLTSAFPEERSAHLCCCALGWERLLPCEIEQ